ncbi:unnamed protein product [Clonostachys byssicola]|uniref:Uncharacterized protein n=1 Tax=Clonostachys byssicola TaxID=160290 RepID=A0A9N9UG09_9HYPO|nr:unnamed protein product [Clonostachys byssicola]
MLSSGVAVIYTSLFLSSHLIRTVSPFQKQHTPLGYRSSRSTPATGVSPFAATGEPGRVSVSPTIQRELEGPKDPESATTVPIRTSNSQENACTRPSFGLTSYTTLTNRHFADIDPSSPLNNSASKSQKFTRFRNEWEAYMGVEPRESSNYERHWRGETPARYKTRRGYRPPPSILNSRYGTTSQELDDEVYDDSQSFSRDPLDAPRTRRTMDEEMGYQTQPFFTGGSLNPARSFGPCAIAGKFDEEHWIYWVGPFVGSVIVVLFYRFIKTLEYEIANPGADSDDARPSKIHEKIVETPYVKAAPSVAASSRS